MPRRLAVNPLAPLLITSSMMDWPAWPSNMPMVDTGDVWSRLPEAQLPMMKETPTGYQVQFAAAGIKPSDLRVTIDNNILKVQGESKSEHDGWEYTSSIERSIQLPKNIDATAIEAISDHGMLCISVPKMELQASEAPRLIPIKPAPSSPTKK